MNVKDKAYLLLEDGFLMEGVSIGAKTTSGGEICFNTGMTGYQEIYTDPSYFGQIIVNTTAHIGNYGTVDQEQESATPKIRGLVVNEFSANYSRKTAHESLQQYLEKHPNRSKEDFRTLEKSSQFCDIEHLKKMVVIRTAR